MQTCRLPVEVCEAVIDAIRPDFDNWFDFDTESHALWACALTCRAWRPRAQLVLWTSVFLQHHERIPPFVAVVQRSPARLAPCVRTLCVHPFSSGPVPLRLFAPALPALRVCAFEGVPCMAFPPRAARMRMRAFAALVELRMSRCGFQCVGDLCDLVWACARLERLTVLDCTYAQPPEARFSEADALRIAGMRRRPDACAKLARLKLFGHPFDHPAAPPGSVFGSAVTEFEMVYFDLASSISLGRTLSSFTALHTLSIVGFLLDADTWKTEPALIHSVLSALPPRAPLRTFVLHVETSYETDERTLDALCGREVHEPPDAGATAEPSAPTVRTLAPGLTRLEVSIAGVPMSSQPWWSAQVKERMPSTCGILTVAVTKIKERGLW
ncbi:hypothetical protein BD413DRAFT_613478 [Trametes elegans]|nr:hypothetical protein BD413DRAFT_613478 [Trametes elegans]